MGVLANIPVCLSRDMVPEVYKDLWVSRKQNTNTLVCRTKDVEAYEALYEPDFQSEGYSPFNSDVSFSGLPPTYVQVAGLDCLRDDGLLYARALRESGVTVKLGIYPGMPHGNYVVWPHLKQPFKSQVDTISHVGWLLGCQVDREEVERVWNFTIKH